MNRYSAGSEAYKSSIFTKSIQESGHLEGSQMN